MSLETQGFLSLNFYSDPLIPFSFTIETDHQLYSELKVSNEHIMATRELICCRTHNYTVLDTNERGSTLTCKKCGGTIETILENFTIRELFANNFDSEKEYSDETLLKFISDTICGLTDNIFAFYKVEEYLQFALPIAINEVMVVYNMRKTSRKQDEELRKFWLEKHLALSPKFQNISTEIFF